MTKTDRKYKVAEILQTDTPIKIELDPEKIEFLILYKYGLVQYMSPKQFSWIAGVHKDTIYKKIEGRVYPYHLFFTKGLGKGPYRMHISRVSSLMTEEVATGDTQKSENKKGQSIGKEKTVAHLPMSRLF